MRKRYGSDFKAYTGRRSQRIRKRSRLELLGTTPCRICKGDWPELCSMCMGTGIERGGGTIRVVQVRYSSCPSCGESVRFQVPPVGSTTIGYIDTHICTSSW